MAGVCLQSAATVNSPLEKAYVEEEWICSVNLMVRSCLSAMRLAPFLPATLRHRVRVSFYLRSAGNRPVD